ncbi:hemerythrin domain-containing protein [Blastopirellula sp. J2-11]|uniref:hemerythrin domain-containing protein n=1 Tax=Blastopirellula sp. J2-11 TaxID=2943192 RepID=UPI0021C8E093|nr:hemerythrin domain-containing protein [Blastopirellula sp. J2-11]UUO06533.1 hemerythrin domain-containing protein [Blastopirellula sp. J2-11]
MTDQTVRLDFHALVMEHDLLRDILGVLSADDNGRTDWNSLPAMFDELYDRLNEHFLAEEHGGYMNDALRRAPHLAEEAARLAGEHPMFLVEIQECRKEAEDQSAPYSADLRGRFRKFTERYFHHEHHENSLVQRAFDIDIGVGD